MDYKEYQDRFDYIKWMDSILVGKDRCGSYDMCKYCKKEENYPCARAAERLEKGYVRIAVIHCHH